MTEMANETVWQARLRTPGRGLLLTLIGLSAMLAGLFFITVVSTIGGFLGVLFFPRATRFLRSRVDRYRRVIGRWTGVEIERPYLPEPEAEPGLPGRFKSFVALISDPATWRDYLWVSVDPFVLAFTAALPIYMILYGIWGFLLAAFAGGLIADHGGNEWYTFVHVDAGYAHSPLRLAGTLVVATAFIAGAFLSGPPLMAVYIRWARHLLGPTERSRLALRVRHLTETRSDAVDASAAELRRIERDLHDGAQARLVAMGMSLGAIEHLLDRDPEKARLLLAQTRESSTKALHELRDLVRGIHPPVLADRGLGDAIKALSLDHPLRPEVTVELAGRPEPPVESAVYFAVSEILTNAAKHADASHVWVDLRHERGMLRVTVTDNGRGGATLDGGTGLRGLERRIGTFDGVLALSSPVGGPTIVTLELPCALSSPKISPS
ncbi:sensor histidine kinase [Actinomadura roseirufa]|uniref:sensor histidine kinase n=1 Tax=Actinomadura roseirufa TaxID=2094049 RepID=UPI001F5F7A28|nr:sensor histidine kinase [Actinomadura roseirufa]